MVGDLDIIGHTLPRIYQTETTIVDFLLNDVRIIQSSLPTRNTILESLGVMFFGYAVDVIIGNCPLINLKADIRNGNFRIRGIGFGVTTMGNACGILCNGFASALIQRTGQCHLNGFVGLHIANILDRERTAAVGIIGGCGSFDRNLLQNQALGQCICKHQRIIGGEAAAITSVIAVTQIICNCTGFVDAGCALRFGESTIAKAERVLIYGYRCILCNTVGTCRCGIDDITACAIIYFYLYCVILRFTGSQINAAAGQIGRNQCHLGRICKGIRNSHAADGRFTGIAHGNLVCDGITRHIDALIRALGNGKALGR